MSTLPAFPSVSAPAWRLLGAEPARAVIEYAAMRLMNKTALPRGDGHAVVIFPGLATNHHAVAPLKGFCTELGYAAYDWDRGFNTGPRGELEAWLDDLAQHVLELTRAHPEPVSLIGWSLGGIYAREIAKKLASRVRQVITIGTPFAGSAEQTHASGIYRLLSGQDPVIPAGMMKRLRTAPDVPTTSIFSRSDGIVAWQTCIQEADAPHTENIEVDGSHCGLGWNPQVLSIIADRLQQPMGAWQRHESASSFEQATACT
ncbi:alpha/beta fold hydrolase [Piscinibacter terrae]|uniref:Alpha/beta fold hydrolase n=1 Tax=Piscinibacter terrae TaxID=2496871 RepID=A0A3N7HM66_9BURK|nr:alpha/beta fold hydrolase [Albitalea terrae]RQP22703.1 alpha/beta fold hydrolase [Albitalea terrae]